MQKACGEPCRASPTPRTAKVIAMHQRRCSEASLMLLAWQSQVRLHFFSLVTVGLCQSTDVSVLLLAWSTRSFPHGHVFWIVVLMVKFCIGRHSLFCFQNRGQTRTLGPPSRIPYPPSSCLRTLTWWVKADAQLAKVGGGWEQMARDAKWTLWPCLPCLDCRGIGTFRRRCWQPIARVMKQCYDSDKN